MIHSLIQQLRDRYPMGSLTADLLMLHDNQYIVRAVVQLDRSVVATGMAASSDLAQAEDLAKSRALQSLGLEAKPEAMPLLSADLPVQAEDLKAANPQLQTDRLETELPLTGFSAERSPQLEEQQPSNTNILRPPEAPSGDEVSDPFPLLSLPAEPPEPFLPDPSAPSKAPIESPTLNTGPVDLSDILAQTDVELRRLGWSVQQGREFLEQTYSKRSRHDLSDEELLEFLLYLEKQPAPIEH
ncbi:MAG: hypothetical protein HC886_18350 [Leptolyngbyaceae cyanobacterium SM1_1_3]|nr:hypothetical protein [Leptolyngbyaceae cyanobacterium SM1_1_3]NJN01141.1 hypothetical protein [Leptolyngbyaceae cyanobacterium RM1_1_2]NJO09279.1 hypothetical protein [Leptolyngbyaceae cyanobacterium SL_1_1]